MRFSLQKVKPTLKAFVSVFTVQVLLISQFFIFGSSKVGAIPGLTALSYQGGSTLLAGYPQNIANVNVRGFNPTVVTTDGHIYTQYGQVPNIDNVAKAYVSLPDDTLPDSPENQIGFAIKNDGTLWSWGIGYLLGRTTQDIDEDGINDDDLNPGQITGLPSIQDIRIGWRSHIIALDTNGEVWTWGRNRGAQLGRDLNCTPSSLTPSNRPECDTSLKVLPGKIPGLSTVQNISVNESGGLAYTAAGDAKIWGTICDIESTWPYYYEPTNYTEMGALKQAVLTQCNVAGLKEDGSVYSRGVPGGNPSTPRSSLKQLFWPGDDIESIDSSSRSIRAARSKSGIGYIWDHGTAAQQPPSTHSVGNIGKNSIYMASEAAGGSVVVLNYSPQNFADKLITSDTSQQSVNANVNTQQLDYLLSDSYYNLSKDGTKVVSVARDQLTQRGDIYASNADGGDRVNITNTENIDEANPKWSPDRSKILFYASDADTGTFGIYIMNADGTGKHQVADSTDNIASWSPDGAKITFSKQFAAIGTVDANGQNEQLHYIDGRYAAYPGWSPDGNRIAFLAIDIEQNQTFNPIYLETMNVDGTNDQVVYQSTPDTMIGFFDWSPDSTKLAVMKAYNSTPKQYIVSVDVNSHASETLFGGFGLAGQFLQWWEGSEMPVDTTAPVLGTPGWSTNPKTITGASTFTVPVTDEPGGSGVSNGEYFLGDNDPGQGSGATMNWDGANLTATFGSDFPTGVYKVGVRARDNAGNWSTVTAEYLVVYDPSGLRMTGKRTIVPALSNGDILPGLIAANQTDKAKFAFNVKYNNQGQIHANSDLQLTYSTGTKCNNPAKAQNCHDLSLNATNIEWLTTEGTNNSTGIFQGTATLNIDGTVSAIVFRVTGVDGERLNPTSLDQFQIKIYAQNGNPNADTPLYRINSADIARGNVKIL